MVATTKQKDTIVLHTFSLPWKGTVWKRRSSDLVDVLVLELYIVILRAGFLLINDALVEPDVVGDLAVGLEQAGLVVHVLEDDVRLVVLVVAQADEHDVPGGDPHLLVHLAPDVAEALGAVDAERLAAAVAQHPRHLRVLLPVLLEHQLPLLVVRLVLAPLPVLASLSLVLRHRVAGEETFSAA
jgi:hypothetical protein|uniref:Uncharacterized protein n=1 Tax=Zea mays TaxID=4577 RepID=C4J483_MAIZE|nr:unknown [Zea mays]